MVSYLPTKEPTTPGWKAYRQAVREELCLGAYIDALFTLATAGKGRDFLRQNEIAVFLTENPDAFRKALGMVRKSNAKYRDKRRRKPKSA